MNHAKSIPYFRGVFMRDELPKTPLENECGIINLDISKNPGTHWVAYAKFKNYVEYFDSYGDLKPPKEFVKYVGSNISYNYCNFQKKNTFNCGHLCIHFLNKFWRDFKNINSQKLLNLV